MSTVIEQLSSSEQQHQHEQVRAEFSKPAVLEDSTSSLSSLSATPLTSSAVQQQQFHHRESEKSGQQHPLHQFDLTAMRPFYKECERYLASHYPAYKPTEWAKVTPMPLQSATTTTTTTTTTINSSINPVVISEKQRVFERFAALARDLGEPMVLLPDLDVSDLGSFELFLDALKSEGLGAVRHRYRQYVEARASARFRHTVDLVCVHARYGLIVLECEEAADAGVDARRRARAKQATQHARSLFRALARLIAEAHGGALSSSSSSSNETVNSSSSQLNQSSSVLPVLECVALPNVHERPISSPVLTTPVLNKTSAPTQEPAGRAVNPSQQVKTSSAMSRRELVYLIREDLASPAAFAQWWARFVVEPKLELEKQQQQQQQQQQVASSKFEWPLLGELLALVHCIRSNALLPVVYPEVMGSSSSSSSSSSSDETTALLATLLLSSEEKREQQKEAQLVANLSLKDLSLNREEEKSADLKDKQQAKKEEEQEKKEKEEAERLLKEKEEQLKLHFQPALNVHAEFFAPKHEAARALSKCLVLSKDAERLRHTLCLQTLWLLLNDTQKKVSVVCSEANKPYYEEFFARQRQVHADLHGVRFYTDVAAAGGGSDEFGTTHHTSTLRRRHNNNNNNNNINSREREREELLSEMWLLDVSASSLKDVLERVKHLPSFWVLSTAEPSAVSVEKLAEVSARLVNLDEDEDEHRTQVASKQAALGYETQQHTQQSQVTTLTRPSLTLSRRSIKLPMRLQCDLLVVGDMISQSQLKYLYRYLQTKSVPSQAKQYADAPTLVSGSDSSTTITSTTNTTTTTTTTTTNPPSAGEQHSRHHHHQHQQFNDQHRSGHYQQQQQHPLNFNPAKKFRSVKFVRGGTIENLRNALKMHDSVQAQVVVLHVGDEDLFKTRDSVATIERVKELATLVREYCPRAFVVLSTLMRRPSRTENLVTGEVNRGIVAFCKQTRLSLNCFYMHNAHFEPDYHTQGGRLLNTRGLRQYVDNVLFTVDYFHVKNNKQH